jgi:hypothetical protein
VGFDSNGLPWVTLALLVISVAYVVVTRMYINDITRSHCTCAESLAFKVLNVVNIINIVMFVLAVVLVLLRVALNVAHRGASPSAKYFSSRRR